MSDPHLAVLWTLHEAIRGDVPEAKAAAALAAKAAEIMRPAPPLWRTGHAADGTPYHISDAGEVARGVVQQQAVDSLAALGDAAPRACWGVSRCTEERPAHMTSPHMTSPLMQALWDACLLPGADALRARVRAEFQAQSADDYVGALDRGDPRPPPSRAAELAAQTAAVGIVAAQREVVPVVLRRAGGEDEILGNVLKDIAAGWGVVSLPRDDGPQRPRAAEGKP